jgi:hypothetical protein
LLARRWTSTSSSASTRSTSSSTAPPLRLAAEQAGPDHARVVDDDEVTFAQKPGQLAEHAIDRRRAARIEQARRAALGGRVLRDQLGRQLEVEVAEGRWRVHRCTLGLRPVRP